MSLIQRLWKELPAATSIPYIGGVAKWWSRKNLILKAWLFRNDLTKLAKLFGTDKWGAHSYTQHYQRYFHQLRKRRLNILEIGVGGYENSEIGGQSLRMWKTYFSNSQIVGIDIEDKTHFREERIDIRVCSQVDEDALKKLDDEYGGFDIIVDDGSHISWHVIKTFCILFPLLRENGIYVVEDVQTAYWTTWGGGINSAQNSVSFFKNLIDGLNHAQYPIANYSPSYFDENIFEIAFLHNMVFIRKGKNTEKSNAPHAIRHEMDALAQRDAEALQAGGTPSSP